MSNYSRQDDFSAKSGTTIFGSDVDAEFDAVLTAVNSKLDASDRGAANGVASLGAGVLVPVGISGNATSGGGQLPEATATALGAVELATSGEATTLTDPSRVITPATLAAVITAAAGTGLIEESTGVLGVSLNEVAAETSIALNDYIIMIDVTDNGTQKITRSNFITSMEPDVNHDALSGFVANEHIDHSAVSVTAGSGLTGGGAITGTVTLNIGAGTGISVAADSISVDFSGTTNIEGNVLAATDSFAVNDGGVLKQIDYQDMGYVVQTAQTSQTLAASDMNTIMEFDTTATLTIPLNSTTALPVGACVIIVNDNASTQVTVTAAASVTLNSINHPGGTVAASDKVMAGGTACLIKTQTNEWYLSGNIVD